MPGMHTFKTIIFILFLIAIILGMNLYTIHTLENSSDTLEAHINPIEASLKKQDWTGAQNEFELLRKQWQRIEKAWTILVDHFEIDNIDISIRQVGAYIDGKEETDALAEMTALRQYIRHLPQKEYLKLKNIF